jgi:uncharacterized membrane protein YphA (DoxX/SURF4 family)
MATDAVTYDSSPLPRWEMILRKVILVIARIGLAYLFFTQLWWKAPPTFGCPPDFAFTTATIENNRPKLQRTGGLCDWMGIEQVYSKQPRPLLVANLDNKGEPEISINIAPIARLNGIFLESVIMPTIRFSGWLLWLAEAAIVVTLLLGLFSRLGGLIAVAVSAQLMIGLSGIPNPYEWEWAYNTIFVLSLLMFAFAPGRVFGIDALLRPRLLAAKQRGSRFAGLLSWLT